MSDSIFLNLNLPSIYNFSSVILFFLWYIRGEVDNYSYRHVMEMSADNGRVNMEYLDQKSTLATKFVSERAVG